MVKLTIDEIEVEVPPDSTVLHACEAAGAEIPRFCYHERLSIAGNCRMCLVEMERSPKPIASCAMPVAEGMVIRTQSEVARKARRGVMEFLLINHPLDCPICDQGGECDLQDQAMAFGFDRSRYSETKRAVRDKHLGPLIKTVMTRCIHCTRCIRFATEIAGVSTLGATGRGEEMEIGTYIEQAIASELSGNLVDVCPVGALTSRPYAFTARSWELHKTASIDVLDAVGANTRIDAVGQQIMRVLPRLHEDINEEWLADKGRYAIDGLRHQRLDRPYMRRDGRLVETSWDEALRGVAHRLQSSSGPRIATVIGDQMDIEAGYALRQLMQALGSPHLECRQDGAKIDPTQRVSYLFNTTIAGIERADACLLIATNPRIEAPLINARLRKRYLLGGFSVGLIGPGNETLTYPVDHIGTNAQAIQAILEKRHPFAKTLAQAQHPMLILGQAALRRDDGMAVLGHARQIAEDFGMVKPGGANLAGWNGFNLLHLAAARVGALELGFTPGQGGYDIAQILRAGEAGEIDCLYLLGADEIDLSKIAPSVTVIYQGAIGDAGASRADIVLPGSAWTEKDASYVNTEGRLQRCYRAVFPPGEARDDWKIVRALSDYLGHRLPFNDLEGLRALLERDVPHLREDTIAPALWTSFGSLGKMDDAPFTPAMPDYYMSCAISRASPTMASCSEAFTPAPAGTHNQSGSPA